MPTVGRKVLRKQKSDSDFIGVPPDMTNTVDRAAQLADFEDEEEEIDAVNNLITQADLFKSYAAQNSLYCNVSNVAHWFEFGGRQLAKLSLDIVAL